MEIYLKVLPVAFLVLLGYALKRSKLMSSDDGSSLLKYVFYVAAPAVIIKSLSSAKIETSFLAFAVAPVLIVSSMLAAGYLLKKTLLNRIDLKQWGSLVAGMAILNTGFMIPVISSFYGDSGLAKLAVADGVNAILVFSVVYIFACKAGGKNSDMRFIIDKVSKSPPIWAILAALVINLTNFNMPTGINSVIASLAATASPAILIAVGLKINVKISKFRLVNTSIVVRFLIGLGMSILLSKIFDLHSSDLAILSLISLAPIGFNSITFAELEGLDIDIAVSQVFVSIIYYLVIILPLVMIILSK